MKIGLYLNPQTGGAHEDHAILDSITRDAVKADRAGFNAVWLTDHHFNDYNTFGDPFLMGARLAPELKNAWIVLTVATLAIRNPIRFAEQANLLDYFMKGRFIAGYGAGGSVIEFSGFGRDVGNRHEVMLEVLDTARKAWAQTPDMEPMHYRTAYDSGTLRGRIMPAGHRKPHPLLGRGTLSEDGIRQTARRGHVFFMGRLRPDQAAEQLALYEAELRAACHAEDHIQLCLDRSGPVRMIFIAPTDEEAYEQVGPIVDNYIAYSRASGAADRAERERLGMQGGRKDLFVERDDLLDRAVIWGGPEKVAGELAKFQAVGLRQFTAWFNWGNPPLDQAERSLDLFIDEVMPRLDDVRFVAASVPA